MIQECVYLQEFLIMTSVKRTVNNGHISVMNNVSTIGKLMFNLNIFKSLDIQNMYIVHIIVQYNKLHFIQKVACNNKRHNFINKSCHIHIIGIKHTRYLNKNTYKL